MLIVEPVDEHGAPVPAGVRAAKVYLTTLCNPVQPLIRYELTDEVTMLAEPCPCGLVFRRVGDIQGRLDDVFRYAEGVAVHPHIFRTVLGRHPAVREYQVRQTPTGAQLLVCAADDLPVVEIARQVEAELVRVGLRAPQVNATVVDGFERRGTGKLKRFVPL